MLNRTWSCSPLRESIVCFESMTSVSTHVACAVLASIRDFSAAAMESINQRKQCVDHARRERTIRGRNTTMGDCWEQHNPARATDNRKAKANEIVERTTKLCSHHALHIQSSAFSLLSAFLLAYYLTHVASLQSRTRKLLHLNSLRFASPYSLRQSKPQLSFQLLFIYLCCFTQCPHLPLS